MKRIGYSPEYYMHGKRFWKQRLIVIISNQDLLRKLGFSLPKLVEMKWKEPFLFGKKSLDTKVIRLGNILIYLGLLLKKYS